MMFFEIGVLKNFANFAGKNLCWSLFLIKLQAYSKQKQSFAHVLKNFVNFPEKHLCWSLFLIKFLTNFIKGTLTQVFSCEIQKIFKNTLIQNSSSGCFCQKRLQHKCLTVKFAKFLRTSFFTEHLRWLLLNGRFCLVRCVITRINMTFS